MQMTERTSADKHFSHACHEIVLTLLLFQSQISVRSLAACPHVLNPFPCNFSMAFWGQHDLNAKALPNTLHHSLFVEKVIAHFHQMAQAEVRIDSAKFGLLAGKCIT